MFFCVTDVMKKSAHAARLFKPKFAKLSLLTVKKFLSQYYPRVGRWSLVNNSQNLLNVVKNDPLHGWQAQPKHNCQIHNYVPSKYEDLAARMALWAGKVLDSKTNLMSENSAPVACKNRRRSSLSEDDLESPCPGCR